MVADNLGWSMMVGWHQVDTHFFLCLGKFHHDLPATSLD
jgi:hypothetical protein